MAINRADLFFMIEKIKAQKYGYLFNLKISTL